MPSVLSSSLVLRSLSSLILIPVVFGAIWAGGWFFGAFVALCIGLAFAEWVNLVTKLPKNAAIRSTLTIIGFLYMALAFYEISDIRLNAENGLAWCITLFLCIWASDTLAYILGKTVGGPKMTPTVSPNKTWSGYLGALLGPAIMLPLCLYFIEPGASNIIPALFAAGAVLGIVGQSGDLLVSMLKRKAGIKDTGNIIPGHGGILDRIDALLLVIPVFYAYISIINMS